jgi:hypothetical protein
MRLSVSAAQLFNAEESGSRYMVIPRLSLVYGKDPLQLERGHSDCRPKTTGSDFVYYSSSIDNLQHISAQNEYTKLLIAIAFYSHIQSENRAPCLIFRNTNLEHGANGFDQI